MCDVTHIFSFFLFNQCLVHKNNKSCLSFFFYHAHLFFTSDLHFPSHAMQQQQKQHTQKIVLKFACLQLKKCYFLYTCSCQTHGQNAAHAELMLMHRMNSICCQTICAETDDDDANAWERKEICVFYNVYGSLDSCSEMKLVCQRELLSCVKVFRI